MRLRHLRTLIGLGTILVLTLYNAPVVTAAAFTSIAKKCPHSARSRNKFQTWPVLPPPAPSIITDNTELRMGLLDDFFQNVDDFIDDATNRKLGGGSTFYGERKSSFSETPKSYKTMSRREADKRETAQSLAIASSKNFDPLRKLRAGKLSGQQLRDLVFRQWGQRFPVLIKRKRDALGQQRLYLIVQWKYLGKRNLDLTPELYDAESDAVASLLTEWGVANQVRNAIGESTARPKTETQQYPGLFIPLDVERDVVDTW